MRASLGLLALLGACASAPRTGSDLSAARPLATARQLVVVRSADWQATSGELRRYQRREAGWSEVGDPAPVTLGRSGLAWGRGLHGAPPGRPIKREGDGRAPAGAFALTASFG